MNKEEEIRSNVETAHLEVTKEIFEKASADLPYSLSNISNVNRSKNALASHVKAALQRLYDDEFCIVPPNEKLINTFKNIVAQDTCTGSSAYFLSAVTLVVSAHCYAYFHPQRKREIFDNTSKQLNIIGQDIEVLNQLTDDMLMRCGVSDSLSSTDMPDKTKQVRGWVDGLVTHLGNPEHFIVTAQFNRPVIDSLLRIANNVKTEAEKEAFKIPFKAAIAAHFEAARSPAPEAVFARCIKYLDEVRAEIGKGRS